MNVKRVLSGTGIVVVATNNDDVVDAVFGPFDIDDEAEVQQLATAYAERNGGETKLMLLTSPEEIGA
jgi:hypothetical protein